MTRKATGAGAVKYFPFRKVSLLSGLVSKWEGTSLDKRRLKWFAPEGFLSLRGIFCNIVELFYYL
jgi:hypothetical protein